MATSLKDLEKDIQIDYLSFGEKIAKIGPVDPPEIIGIRAILKKEKKRN